MRAHTIIGFCCILAPRMHNLVGRLPRARHNFSPRAQTIACFVAPSPPHNLHLVGRLHRFRGIFAPRAYTFVRFCCIAALPESSFWWVVSSAFVTNWLRALLQCLVFVAAWPPRVHILVSRFQRIRHTFVARAYTISGLCLHCRFPESTCWWVAPHRICYIFAPSAYTIACFFFAPPPPQHPHVGGPSLSNAFVTN